jgi:hypothetical protein
MGEMLQANDIRKPVKVFLAAAIFAPEDTLSVEYFAKYRSSLDAQTGTDIFVGLPEMKDGMVVDLAKLFAPEGQARYPGLKHSDLPCLWIEDERKEHRIVRLPHDQTKFTKLIRGVTDAAATASSFEEFNMAIDDLQSKLDPALPVQQQAPSWFAKAGFASAAVAFFFLVGLVILSIFDKDVPASAKILVDIAIAIAVACAFAFFGGVAHAEGKIPFFKGHEPVKFATEGGIGAFVLTLILTVWFYH